MPCLSKVHISEPERKSCMKLESVRCSMCEGVSSKTVLYVCESGHVVCETCQKTDDGAPGLQSCDAKSLKSDSNIKKIQGHKIANALCYQDFASGDHNHCSKCINRKPKSMSANNIQVDKKLLYSRKIISEEEKQSKNKETMLKYKNKNFSDNESSVSCSGINEKKITKKSIRKNSRIQRPVTCPVTDCGKMVARDLILQHFYFDHSKVPRIPISDFEPHHDFLNASSFTEKTSCYAVFLSTAEKICASLLHTTDAGGLLNGGYKNVSFLLMGVRMPCAFTDTIKNPHGSGCVSMLPVQPQNDINTQSSKNDVTSGTTVADHDLEVTDTNQHELGKELINKNNVVMLWICKLSKKKYYYNIAATRADKKLAYSFTGETVEIEYSHNPRVMWDKMECLLIQEKSLNKLTNKQNLLEISVTIFK